jgi:hypothetical protein
LELRVDDVATFVVDFERVGTSEIWIVGYVEFEVELLSYRSERISINSVNPTDEDEI